MAMNTFVEFAHRSDSKGLMEGNDKTTAARLANRPGNPDAAAKYTELVDLIGAMAAGEQQALARFYDLTSRQVYGLTFHIVKDAGMAEEVTLNVYLQVWRESSRYRLERGNPLAWLMVLARSRALDELRKNKGDRQYLSDALPDADSAAALDKLPEDEASAAECAAYVQAALAQINPDQRQVLLLSFYEGLSHAEIAEHLKLPLGTVKTRIRTGILRLHELLMPRFGDMRPNPAGAHRTSSATAVTHDADSRSSNRTAPSCRGSAARPITTNGLLPIHGSVQSW
ncbi:MAG: sigma-70 family RNA polymerase sigma factor [Gammaproteobacteria bacterium]